MRPAVPPTSPAARKATPLWANRLVVSLVTFVVAAIGAWLWLSGIPAFRTNMAHPWVRQCMASDVAPSAASFFIPPVHTHDGRYCITAPSIEDVAINAPEQGRAFADRRNLARIEVWDGKAKRYLALDDHKTRVRCFALASPLLLTASDSPDDPAVRLWSLLDGTLLQRLDGGRPGCWGGFSFMGLSPDHQLAVTATDDQKVHVWTTGNGKPAGTFSPGEGPTLFAFSSDRDVIALGGFSGDISLWNWRAGKLLRRWHAHDRFGVPVPDAGGVETLEFSADGTHLRSRGPVNGKESLMEWDVATGKVAAN